jgi:hypothetical protein
MDDSSDAIKSSTLVDNMARGLQDFLLTQQEAHLALPSLTLTRTDLFIDNIGGKFTITCQCLIMWGPSCCPDHHANSH